MLEVIQVMLKVDELSVQTHTLLGPMLLEELLGTSADLSRFVRVVLLGSLDSECAVTHFEFAGI